VQYNTKYHKQIIDLQLHQKNKLRTIMGNHKRAIEWCQYRWSRVTSDPDFKVVAFSRSCLLKMVQDGAVVIVER